MAILTFVLCVMCKIVMCKMCKMKTAVLQIVRLTWTNIILFSFCSALNNVRFTSFCLLPSFVFYLIFVFLQPKNSISRHRKTKKKSFSFSFVLVLVTKIFPNQSYSLSLNCLPITSDLHVPRKPANARHFNRLTVSQLDR